MGCCSWEMLKIEIDSVEDKKNKNGKKRRICTNEHRGNNESLLGNDNIIRKPIHFKCLVTEIISVYILLINFIPPWKKLNLTVSSIGHIPKIITN